MNLFISIIKNNKTQTDITRLYDLELFLFLLYLNLMKLVKNILY